MAVVAPPCIQGNFCRRFQMTSNNQGGNQGKRSSSRGFASMDPQRQREIASEGGRAAHERGTAHEFTSEEAREAGRKGGQARAENRSARQRASSNTGSSESSSDSGSNRGNASDR
jgi:general stress protein YciG